MEDVHADALPERGGKVYTTEETLNLGSSVEDLLALRTRIAVRRQPAAVERIVGRRFEADQVDAPTIAPAVGAGQ